MCKYPLTKVFLSLSPHSDYLFKLLLIGDSGVGKSCLLLRFAVGLSVHAFEIFICLWQYFLPRGSKKQLLTGFLLRHFYGMTRGNLTPSEWQHSFLNNQTTIARNEQTSLEKHLILGINKSSRPLFWPPKKQHSCTFSSVHLGRKQRRCAFQMSIFFLSLCRMTHTQKVTLALSVWTSK